VRSLIWIVLFLLGLTGVIVPVGYLYTASKLPRLESEYDLETHLRLLIEGHRIAAQSGQFTRDKRPIPFERPEFGKLPRDMVALYISQLGCPTYFQTPREEGLEWIKRLLAIVTNSVPPPGDGRCERYMSARLVATLGVKGTLDSTVAVNKLHGILQRDQLLAYDLATTRFGHGVYGVMDGAPLLYGKELHQMTLAELAEFTLALPINGYLKEIRICQNSSLIRQARDAVLQRLQHHALASEERVREALAAPVACAKDF
jgi:hypothetical protein